MIHDDDKAKPFYPLKSPTALLIVLGGIMHLIGLILALVYAKSLPPLCWFFFLFAIIMYPVSAVMIVKNIRWGYWITAIAPSVGGLFIFIGFFWPSSGLLMLLAGNFGKEITWLGFIQVFSESMAVAYAIPLIYYKAWQISPVK